MRGWGRGGREGSLPGCRLAIWRNHSCSIRGLAQKEQFGGLKMEAESALEYGKCAVPEAHSGRVFPGIAADEITEG